MKTAAWLPGRCWYAEVSIVIRDDVTDPASINFSVCVCVRARACVRGCVRACARVCVNVPLYPTLPLFSGQLVRQPNCAVPRSVQACDDGGFEPSFAMKDSNFYLFFCNLLVRNFTLVMSFINGHRTATKVTFFKCRSV